MSAVKQDIGWNFEHPNDHWLVVWNIFYFSIIYGNNPFQLTFIFFKMVETTNQYTPGNQTWQWEILYKWRFFRGTLIFKWGFTVGFQPNVPCDTSKSGDSKPLWTPRPSEKCMTVVPYLAILNLGEGTEIANQSRKRRERWIWPQKYTL